MRLGNSAHGLINKSQTGIELGLNNTRKTIEKQLNAINVKFIKVNQLLQSTLKVFVMRI